MDLYLVVDTLGAGRIVGVFSSRKVADEVASVEPHYYQLHECRLDAINPDALTWAQSDEQREALERIMAR